MTTPPDQQNPSLGRYQSAADIPSMAEMISQLEGLRLLNTVFRGDQNIEIARIEQGLDEMIGTVDGFYDLLGDKNWILHENLNFEKVKQILRDNSNADHAEMQLIDLYDEDAMGFMLHRANWFEASRNRASLIEKAKQDYFDKRYYSCVLVLLAVIDGFVNEFESKHKGFHARESAEFSAWDTIISHHKGIERVHGRIYLKSVSKTKTEPVYDLFRHGIMHGTIVDFDNVIVATKAWNLLFSVLDWATAKEQAAKSKEPEMSLEELIRREAHREEGSKVMASYVPYILKPEDRDFSGHEAVVACRQFLDYWLKSNYGGMSGSLPNLFASYGKTAPKRVRDEYDAYKLGSYELTELESTAPVLVTIRAKLVVNGFSESVELKWIYEARDGLATVPQQGDGQWHFQFWTVSNFIKELKKVR